MTYQGPAGTAGAALWLAEHVTSLAMTEGCEEARDEIEHAMGQCRRACDRPDEDHARLPLDPHGEALVYGLELNAKACADMARSKGVEGLTKRRVLYLVDAEAVKPLRTVKVGKWKSPILRLGEVVAAHRKLSTPESA